MVGAANHGECRPGPEMAEHIIKIWEKPHAVSVHRESKSVWVAIGDYMGESIRVQGRSESAALRHWCEAARNKATEKKEKPRR